MSPSQRLNSRDALPIGSARTAIQPTNPPTSVGKEPCNHSLKPIQHARGLTRTSLQRTLRTGPPLLLADSLELQGTQRLDLERKMILQIWGMGHECTVSCLAKVVRKHLSDLPRSLRTKRNTEATKRVPRPCLDCKSPPPIRS